MFDSQRSEVDSRSSSAFLSMVLSLLAFVASVSAVAVVATPAPVIAVLYLVAVFASTRLYLLALGLGFMGLAYLVVYVGAIAILFLFVVMLLDVRSIELHNSVRSSNDRMPLALCIGMLVAALQTAPRASLRSLSASMQFALSGLADSSVAVDLAPVSQLNQIEAIGGVLYAQGTFPLMVVGVLLLLAMVGPIALCALDRTSAS